MIYELNEILESTVLQRFNLWRVFLHSYKSSLKRQFDMGNPVSENLCAKANNKKLKKG